MPTEYQVQIETADGARLNVRSHGAGPALFLISGLGGTASFWDPVLTNLTKHFTVITLDQRGIGQSTRGSAACNIDLLATDCLEVMNRLNISTSVVLGHSTGGCIAQTLALMAPERISALLLSGTWAKADRYMTELFKMRSALLRLSPAQYASSAVFLSYCPAWLNTNWAVFDKAIAAAPVKEEAQHIVEERVNALMAFDKTSLLHQIKQPTLILGSQDDLMIPFYLQQELASKLPGAQLFSFDYGGHFFPISRSSIFTEKITSWIKTVTRT